MAITAATVIDEARDRHAAFDRKRIPDRMARRFLSNYAIQLHGRILAIDPDALRVDVVTALPLADFDAGIALPAGVRYIADVVTTEPDTVANPRTVPVTLLPAAQRNAPNGPLAAVWQVGSTVYLRSPATLWRYMGSITIAYVPLPVELADLNAVLPVPDAAKLACVESVAAFMARRGSTDSSAPEIDLQEFNQEKTEAEGAYLADVANRLTGQVWITQDTYRPS
ncbi:MAG: hypothetical protein ACRDQZ_13085 [Mycobacteriales bacterium]